MATTSLCNRNFSVPLQYHGTIIVYATHCWPKHHFKAYDCSWQTSPPNDPSSMSIDFSEMLALNRITPCGLFLRNLLECVHSPDKGGIAKKKLEIQVVKDGWWRPGKSPVCGKPRSRGHSCAATGLESEQCAATTRCGEVYRVEIYTLEEKYGEATDGGRMQGVLFGVCRHSLSPQVSVWKLHHSCAQHPVQSLWCHLCEWSFRVLLGGGMRQMRRWSKISSYTDLQPVPSSAFLPHHLHYFKNCCYHQFLIPCGFLGHK